MAGSRSIASEQENNSLVTRFRREREPADPFAEANQFIKRAYGGPVTAFQSYIVGDGGRSEVFTPKVNGHIFPSIQSYTREAVAAQTNVGGGFGGGSSISEIKQLQQQVVALHQMVLGSNVRLAQSLDRFEAETAEGIVRTARRNDPDTFADAVNDSMNRTSAKGTAIKNQIYKGR
jgi:hypothetical protein